MMHSWQLSEAQSSIARRIPVKMSINVPTYIGGKKHEEMDDGTGCDVYNGGGLNADSRANHACEYLGLRDA
jgi:hypothetical protein